MTTKILIGDALEQLEGLPDESVQCCVTSPPYYGLRCYGTDGQIGLEPTPEAHIARLVEVFREVKRVLRKDGVLWLNYGDAYCSSPAGTRGAHAKGDIGDGAYSRKWDSIQDDDPRRGLDFGGAKPKDLLMLPARVALALQADGWWLRSMIPWLKRSAMPESATDRPATAVEFVFMLTKSARYFYDAEAVRQKDCGHASGNGYKRPHRLSYGGRGQDEQWTPGGGRNFRNSDLFYSSLQESHGLISDADGNPLALDVNPAGFAEAHFATFPPKLIEPLIKAATSEKGCCPACAAPWVREVERTFERQSDVSAEKGIRELHQHDQSAGWPGSPRGTTNGKTFGWSPSCACKRTDGPASVPCVVLDPFGGAGTTGLVADRLGRDCILIELNPNYAEMARARIHKDAPLFAEVQEARTAERRTGKDGDSP